MMKIKEIHINECGPLKKIRWTNLEEKNLVLIYGQNESGKSFLVDLIINSLFKSKKEWGYVRSGTDGKVILTGIKEEKQHEFRPGLKRKLEDYLEQAGPGLPTELIKLLVVRAGEVEIVSQPPGITLEYLKNLFSQKKILNEIADRIPSTVKAAELSKDGGYIQIAQKGDQAIGYLKIRNEELPKLNNLLESVISRYEEGELKTLEMKKKELEEKRRNLLLAKRHKAFNLSKEISSLREELEKLPTESEIDEIRQKIDLFKEKTREALRLKKEIEDKNRDLSTFQELEQEFNLQVKARNHLAYLLNKDKKNKVNKLQRLERDIKLLDHLLKNYRDLIRNKEYKEKELEKKKEVAIEYEWLQALKINYLKLKELPEKPSFVFRLFFFITLFLILASLGLLLIGKTTFSLVLLFFSVVGIILLGVDYYRMSSIWGRSEELARIKKNFREKYGVELKDIATVEAKANLLEKEYREIQAIEMNLEGIKSEIDKTGQEIMETITPYAGSKVEVERWEKTRQFLEEEAQKLKEEIERISETLHRLNVAEKDYEAEPSEVTFNQEKFRQIEKRLEQLNLLKNKVNEEISQLKLLEMEIAELKGEITAWFEKNFREIVEAENWENRIKKLINEKQKLNEKVKEKEGELKGLGVIEDEYLIDDPGYIFSSEEMEKTEKELEKVKESIDTLNKELNDLRTKIASVINGDPLWPWPEILNGLYKKIEAKREELKRREASLIAQILLAEVIKELDREETEKVEEVIHSPQVGEMLNRFTRKYNQIYRLQSSDGQTDVLGVSDGTSEFVLADLSTGAREQVMLALRIAFIEKIFKKTRCFLILDDAFQHSDYERRATIVDTLVDLANLGWQIFYLTMDDHIRDLFISKAASLGERFHFIPL